MVKTIYLSFALLACLAISPIYGQIRHAKGIKAIGANYMITKNGSGASFEFSNYFSNKIYLKGGIGLENGEVNQFKYKGYIFDISGLYTAFNLNDRFFFNGQFGANVSSYKIDNEGYEDENEFKYGPFIGVELESYLTEDLILVLNFNQRFFFSDAFGNNRYLILAGLKYQL